MEATLKFSVTNQIIRRYDKFRPVAKSKDYLDAEFSFTTDEWNGLTKTALFTANGRNYASIIGLDNKCPVPWEVLVDSGYVFVSVFAGSLITVNREKFFVEPTGYTTDIENSQEPTQDLYEQVTGYLDSVKDEVLVNAQNASDSADTAAEYEASVIELSERILNHMDITSEQAEAARGYAESALESRNYVQQESEIVEANSINASDSALAAHNSMETAVSAMESAEESLNEITVLEQSIKDNTDRAEEIFNALEKFDGGTFDDWKEGD